MKHIFSNQEMMLVKLMNLNGFFKAFALCSVLFILIQDASASSLQSTQVFPFEGWLVAMQKAITGPVAFSVSLIGIVCCGMVLIFSGSEINVVIRNIIYLILVISLVIGADSLMSNLFHGATITGICPQVTVV